uniref:Tubulin tyrosine ligase-like family, member 5 n=1 Tax=Mola mola TaxID=94237 RepID=A0A3Q4ACC7_MOLML
VQLQVDAVHDCHVVQYERKLLSLEARKSRRRHLTHRSVARKEKSGKPDVFCLDFLIISLCFFSKVQARVAFSSYLQRVQQRLLAESQANTIPAWPDKDDDQIELVIRFLRRAASNLQEDIKVVLPSRQLPLQDRRCILSHQLGEFISCYNKETDHMVKKQEISREVHCVNSSVFQEYIKAASENDLEEVLTFYTQKNKSSTVFLGTRVQSIKKDLHELNASGNCENSKSEFLSCFFPTKLLFPATLDSTHIRTQHSSTASMYLPLHCPPLPPQPPSYAQSLAKSHFCYSEEPSEPPAYTSSIVVTQPLRAPWRSVSTGSSTVSNGQPAQVLRRIQSFTSNTPTSGAASSIPSAMQIYSQKLSRPTSTGQGKPTSNSVGTFKELNSLSAQSNQQAFISALQKLADKQVARHYASSSNINLLTQHLTKMNLANSMLRKGSFASNPQVRRTAATTPGPPKDEEGTWNGQMQSTYNLATGVNPQQQHQPAHGNYQLQFAIQKLQQQRLQSQPFLDQSHWRHQAGASHAQVPTSSTSCPPPNFHVHPNHIHGHSHVQTCGSPVLVPKPPSSAREGQTRKMAAKRLIK